MALQIFLLHLLQKDCETDAKTIPTNSNTFFISDTFYFQRVHSFDNTCLNLYPESDCVHCAGTTPLV